MSQPTAIENAAPVPKHLTPKKLASIKGHYLCTFEHGAWLKTKPLLTAVNSGEIDEGQVVEVISTKPTMSKDHPPVPFVQLKSGDWCRWEKDGVPVLHMLESTTAAAKHAADKEVMEASTLLLDSHLAGNYMCTFDHGAWVKSAPGMTADNHSEMDEGDIVQVTDVARMSGDARPIKFVQLADDGGWVRWEKDGKSVLTLLTLDEHETAIAKAKAQAAHDAHAAKRTEERAAQAAADAKATKAAADAKAAKAAKAAAKNAKAEAEAKAAADKVAAAHEQAAAEARAASVAASSAKTATGKGGSADLVEELDMNDLYGRDKAMIGAPSVDPRGGLMPTNVQTVDRDAKAASEGETCSRPQSTSFNHLDMHASLENDAENFEHLAGNVPPTPVNADQRRKFNFGGLGHHSMKVLKFNSRGAFKERKFVITKDFKYLAYRAGWRYLWTLRKIKLSNIVRIQPGQHSQNFQPYIEDFRPASKHSLSVYHKGTRSATGKEQVLSVCCQDEKQYTVFYGMIHGFIVDLANKQALKSRDTAYLDKLFDEADTKNKKKLSLNQIKRLLEKMNIEMTSKSLQQKFREADRDMSGYLDREEFPFFIDLLRHRADIQCVWDSITKVPHDEGLTAGRLDKNGRVILDVYYELEQIGETNLKKVDAKISIFRFHEFLTKIQCQRSASGELVTLEETKELVELAVKLQGSSTRGHKFDGEFLTYEIFRDYLSCVSLNEALSPEHKVVHQDMSLPLSDYFIASSHNTYLEGDQWRSNSSTNRYISDMMRGCRCVELDCWDGPSPTYEPLITHGNTITGAISFRDTIHAINDYAFRSSPYPMVLSIEQHCSVVQQIKQVTIMKDIFGDKLVWAAPEGSLLVLPSPTDLQNKIILKGKRGLLATEDDEEEIEAMAAIQQQNKDIITRVGSGVITSVTNLVDSTERRKSVNLARRKSVNSGTSSAEALAELLAQEEAKIKLEAAAKTSLSAASSTDPASPSSSTRGASTSKKSHKETNELLEQQERSGMSNAMSGITFLGTNSVKKFDEESYNTPCDHMCSYSENKTNTLIDEEDKMRGWIRHNQMHLSRIYPKGMRVDSSNYMPQGAWAAGAQLVALNYQTSDDGMYANHGMFRQNGHCGYVLKPEYLRISTVKPPPGVRVQMHILGCAQLPKPGGLDKGEIIDPYVVVEVTGYKTNKRHTTTVVNNNGFDPMFNEVFAVDVPFPETTILTVKVMDADYGALTNEFVAYASYPVSALQQGVRIMQLRDATDGTEGDFNFAALYCRIAINSLEVGGPPSQLYVDLDDEGGSFFRDSISRKGSEEPVATR